MITATYRTSSGNTFYSAEEAQNDEDIWEAAGQLAKAVENEYDSAYRGIDSARGCIYALLKARLVIIL